MNECRWSGTVADLKDLSEFVAKTNVFELPCSGDPAMIIRFVRSYAHVGSAPRSHLVSTHHVENVVSATRQPAGAATSAGPALD
jgi:hypothetical protein